MPSPQATHVPPSASESILMNLARAAMAPGLSLDQAAWPRLDFSDPAQREFGDYELLDELGRGGMGVVYRARQKSLEREVAIKFIAAGIADSLNVARFLGEARAAARLVHPNIVPVHEVGSIDGVHYFSMPLVPGRSLATVIESQPLTPEAAIALLLKLCDAIDYAHRLGLLHLDLKPANVLFDERGEPLVADFGLARRMDERGGADAQEVSGTPSFMAPEQILIKQYRLTPATDIYALGAILYRVLTGVSPHGEGQADDVIRRAAAGRIRPPRELVATIPRDLDAICMKCLELQPGDRYVRVAALADDLRRARDSQPVSVRRIGALERLQRWFRREPRLAFASAGAVLALALGIAATTWQWREAVAQRDAARVAQQQAAQERDRAQIAGEVGARLYSFDGEEGKRAEDLLAWLGQRLPGDEARQAEALTAFAGAVASEDRADIETLLMRVIEARGQDYRARVGEALLAGSDPRRHLYAALLAYHAGPEAEGRAEFARHLAAAIAAQPDDPFVWHVAAVYCDPGVCFYPQAGEQLTRLDGDNMYAWLIAGLPAPEDERWRELLREAAQRTRFDDYLGQNFAAYVEAFRSGAVPVPDLLARPLAMLAPDAPPALIIGKLDSYSLPLAAWSPLVRRCGASWGSPPKFDATVIEDCSTVATAMMRSRGGILSQMIGVAILRVLAKGTPLAEEALQARRRYAYLFRSDNGLSAAQRMGYPTERWLADLREHGELEAWQRQLAFFQLPHALPADWQPEDPTGLLSGYERQERRLATDRESNAALARGDFRGALAALEPVEAMLKQSSGSQWLRSRYLTTRGRAYAGLADWSAAKTALDTACGLTDEFPLGSRETRECAAAQVELYTAWQAAEPDAGQGQQLRHWQDRVRRIEAEAATSR